MNHKNEFNVTNTAEMGNTKKKMYQQYETQQQYNNNNDTTKTIFKRNHEKYMRVLRKIEYKKKSIFVDCNRLFTSHKVPCA